MRFWRQRKDEELDTEIQNHLDEAIRDRIARGESAEQARLNARREFGNVGLAREITRRDNDFAIAAHSQNRRVANLWLPIERIAAGIAIWLQGIRHAWDYCDRLRTVKNGFKTPHLFDWGPSPASSDLVIARDHLSSSFERENE